LSAITDEAVIAETADAYRAHGNQRAAARALGIAQSTLSKRLKRAAERGLLGTDPVVPGFAIKSIAGKMGDSWVKQVREHGEEYETPALNLLMAISFVWENVRGRNPAQSIRPGTCRRRRLARGWRP